MIIVDVEVLMQPGEELGSRMPSVDGSQLWGMLKAASMGHMVLLVPESMRGSLLSAWFIRAGFTAAMNIDYHHAADATEKATVIKDLMIRYGSMDWYVDVNPDTIAHTMSLGIRSLLVAVPETIERPPERITWDQMVSEINRQKTLKAPLPVELDDE